MSVLVSYLAAASLRADARLPFSSGIPVLPPPGNAV